MRLPYIAAIAAACLVSPRPADAVDLPVPESIGTTWSGPYIGGHIGGLAARFEGETSFTAETLPTDATPGLVNSASFDGANLRDEGLLAGVQAGYNFQNRRLVFGVEGDFSWTGIRDSTDFSISAAELTATGVGAIVETVDGFVSEQEHEVDWLATFRGRVGLGTERVLVYATGGLAIAETTSETTFFASFDGNVVAISESDSDTRIGWTLGAGVEGAVTRDISARLEYLFADLGTEDHDLGTYIDITDAFHQDAASEDELTLQLLRFGLNYRF
ncbi:MAG: outer rane immunogenic protein [Phycisphaerales bacterium]|jgi:outer membrane immunogenic protein|nr:outer rane immunogenic protein [Phycisphaerales bacterium]